MSKRKGGDCYRAAFQVMVELHEITEDMIADGDTPDTVLLAHGSPIGRGPIEGVRFGHAWVEVNDTEVIDESNGLHISMDLGAYYAIGKINPDEVVRYTWKQVTENIGKYKTCGPWHETEARHANDRA